jgi:hypothetical protein
MKPLLGCVADDFTGARLLNDARGHIPSRSPESAVKSMPLSVRHR